MLTSPKNWLNWRKSTFIALSHHLEPTGVKKVNFKCIWDFGRLVNTLTAHYEYSHSNRESLPLPVQMHLSKKPKTSFEIFIAFLRSSLYFKQFNKKERHSSSFIEVIDSQIRAYLNAQNVLILKTIWHWTNYRVPKTVEICPESIYILLSHYFNSTWVKKIKWFLVTSEILKLLLNTLTGNYKYFRSNKESLQLPV